MELWLDEESQDVATSIWQPGIMKTARCMCMHQVHREGWGIEEP